MQKRGCVLFLALLAALAAGCLPRERLNESCEWVGDPPRTLDLGDRADRKHLELDVRLAEDLGIRFYDAVGSPTNQEPLGECTEALLAKVAEIHGVTREDVARAAGARDLGIDFLAVYLPTLLVLVLVSRRVARRVDGAFDPEERWLKVGALVALAMLVGALGVPLAEMWSWMVETARLRNGHISYRALRLPVVTHRLEAWLIGVALFACVAAARKLGERDGRARA